MKLFCRIYISLCVCFCFQQAALGANNFLEPKWRARFHAIDVNHDNVLSYDDAQCMSHIFTGAHYMAAEEALVIGGYIETLWKTCVMEDRYTINEQEFVDAYTIFHSTEPDRMKTHLKDCYYSNLVLADTNHNVLISEVEFLAWTLSYGHGNAGAIKTLYQALSPPSEGVPISRLVEEFMELVFTEENYFETFMNGVQ